MRKFTAIIFEENDGVAFITLNRPAISNTVDHTLADEIKEACQYIQQNEAIKCVLINSASADFYIGSEMAGVSEKVNSLPVAREILKLECPSIAVIKGKAFGQGLEIALACDIRIASEEATFAMTQVCNNKMADDCGTQLLPRIVGRAKAIEMLVTGEILNAREAYRIGLISRLVPASDIDSESVKLARQIAAKAPIATRFAKEAVLKGLDLTLEQGLRLETDLYMLIHTTGDRTEGIRAFQEKRQPYFKGK